MDPSCAICRALLPVHVGMEHAFVDNLDNPNCFSINLKFDVHDLYDVDADGIHHTWDRKELHCFMVPDEEALIRKIRRCIRRHFT